MQSSPHLARLEISMRGSMHVAAAAGGTGPPSGLHLALLEGDGELIKRGPSAMRCSLFSLCWSWRGYNRPTMIGWEQKVVGWWRSGELNPIWFHLISNGQFISLSCCRECNKLLPAPTITTHEAQRETKALGRKKRGLLWRFKHVEVCQDEWDSLHA